MFKTKSLAIAAVLCSVAAIFQLIPVFFSHAFVYFTMASAFPIYLITKKKFQLGILSYVVTAIVVTLFSPHEAIIFVFTNGLLGVVLGFLDDTLTNKYIICTIASINLSISLCVVNFLIGIPILGVSFNAQIIEFIIIVIFSTIYTCLYYSFIHYLSKKVKIFRDYLENEIG